MTMIIHDVVQGSQEWFDVRKGIATASEFHTVLAKGKTAGSKSETREEYLYKLAGEIVTEESSEAYGYTNHHMERGKIMEEQARNAYAYTYSVRPQIVGFVTNGRMGCSPDSFVGKSGGLEIKTKIPARLIRTLFRDRDSPPPEHMAQLQGFLLVCEREWVDLVCYWPKMPLVPFRVTRDAAYLTNLRGEIARFNDDLDKVVERIRSAERVAA